MQKTNKYKIPADYYIVFCICASFAVLAFILDDPMRIIDNYIKINISRSILVTDYIALAGIGAALINAAVSTFLYLVLLIATKTPPNGKLIAALFVNLGFSLFGKNLVNTLPILTGVCIYGKVCKIKFPDLAVRAIFSGTIAPLVSEIAFLDEQLSIVKFITAYGAGIFVGFIFPVVMEATKSMHKGYCLYNSGIAGGFITTLFAGMLRSVGIDILPESLYDTSHTLHLALIAYILAVALIIYGTVADKPINAFKNFIHLMNEKDIREVDFRLKYAHACYINIGIMCILATSVVLLLRIPINGPVLGGILTVAGFAAAGKHLINSAPILLGSITAAYLNHFELSAPANALAILFSTGLAPVSGKHGWFFGIFVGLFHVSVAINIGHLNGGLNLYNNGFAESFIAITLVPLIVFFKELFAKQKNLE